MKKILVTGSNGLLGQKITERTLKLHDVELIASSKGENRFPIKEGYAYEEMDILNPNRVREIIKKHHPDAIIHTAAMTNVDICHVERELAYQLNVQAIETLIDCCQEFNVHLIHLSTDFVFDGIEGPYTESAMPNPVSYYGETKMLAEELIKKSTLNWAILRTILVYGVVADMSRSNIVLWAKNELENGRPVRAVNDQWRMPTLAEDLADACLLAVKYSAKGIFHISGKDWMTVADLVHRVAEFWNLDKTLIAEVTSASLNQEAKRPVKTGFVLTKAIDELAYQPHSFAEGLQLLNSQVNK